MEAHQPQQPAAHARFDRVAGVAGSGLLRLREQDLLVTNEKRAEGLELPGDLAKRIDRDGRGHAGKLHNSLVDGDLSVES